MDLSTYSEEQLNRMLKTQLRVSNPDPIVDELLAELQKRQEEGKLKEVLSETE